MTDFASKMAAAKEAGRPSRSVPVCLRGDLAAQLEELDRKALLARADRGGSMEDGSATDLVGRIRELQAEMREATEEFKIRALAPARYRALREEHPPRRDDKGDLDRGDAAVGFNRDTFPPVLVKVSTVSPQLTDEQWHELLGDSDTDAAERAAAGEQPADGLLTYGQFMELADACWELNEGRISVPFSAAVSATSPSTDGE